MKALIYCLFLGLIVSLSSCVTTKYEWKNYDDRLYRFYGNQDINELILSLEQIIKSGEAKNRVPPGIYAEYGYLLYEIGKYEESIIYFEKEQNLWTEASVLMQKMTRNAQQKITLRRTEVSGSMK